MVFYVWEIFWEAKKTEKLNVQARQGIDMT